MNKYKEHLENFLNELELELPSDLVENLEKFSYILREVNQKVNVVSRKMPIEWYWTNHFLDSLLILKCMTFSGLTVMDFGTGGGLPGIPLKLAIPDMKIVLLDATHKKILMVEEMLEDMKLEDCEPVCMRVEDYAAISRRPSFDVVLCRAVSMEPRYVLPLRRLLKKNGQVIFYKAQMIADIEPYKHQTLFETEDEILGKRRLISIKRDDLIEPIEVK